MPLTHATTQKGLGDILASGALLSQVQIGKALRNAETVMETTDDVFLYAAAFTYPGTECGFLFLQSLEADNGEDGISTPFDSGAFATMTKVQAPAPYTDGVAFVRDHELPLPGYRELLCTLISAYSRSPEFYLQDPMGFTCPCGATRAHPFGVIGGDGRAATFEVRIPRRVPLTSPHLRAVFVREGFELPELSALFDAGVLIERYTPVDNGQFFFAMRTACINFILKHLI